MALINAKRGRKKPLSLRVKFDDDAPVHFADQASIADYLYGVDEALVDLEYLVVISNGLLERAKVLRTLPLLTKDPAKSDASSQPRSNSVTTASFLPAVDTMTPDRLRATAWSEHRQGVPGRISRPRPRRRPSAVARRVAIYR